MRGLKRLRETIGFVNFWDVGHTKATPIFRGDKDRDEWQHYQQLRAGAFGHKQLRFTRGDQFYGFAVDDQGKPGGDGIEILSPTPALVTSCNVAKKSNDLSYVLRLSYAGTRILLTGDVEEEAWDDIVAVYGQRLNSDVLQASHHGRDSGYHLKALQLIAPQVVIVSVGRKPDTDASRKYSAQGSKVWSTRRYGTITLEVANNGSRTWTAERNV
jgi:beta-lactamase superfamily II metal-dependent hydrolase